MTSVALLYMCVKTKKSYLKEGIIVTQALIFLFGILVDFQYSSSPQAWFPNELNSFNF